MTRSNPLTSYRFAAFLQVLRPAVKNQWYQIAPLFGSPTQYKSLHKACHVERGELIGVLLDIGLFTFYGMEVRIKKATAFDIEHEVEGIKINYKSVQRKNKKFTCATLIYIDEKVEHPIERNNVNYLRKCKDNYFRTIYNKSQIKGQKSLRSKRKIV